jgi:penicillin-binding protein 2
MPSPPEKKRWFEAFDRRVSVMGVALFFAFTILVARLWMLQVVHGRQYDTQANEQRLHYQWLTARRGMIYGGDDAVLADNRPACDLVVVPAECEDHGGVTERLEALLQIDVDELRARLADPEGGPHTQLLVKRDITRSELARVEELSFALPGVHTIVRPQRRYLHGATGGQILGYIGEIGPDELERLRPKYKQGDLLGRSGLERHYEERLHGEDGQLVVVRYAWGVPQMRTNAFGEAALPFDSYGRELQENYRRKPTAGEPLYVTLNIGLQRKAEELLVGEQGAIAVINADTGAVLALASAPRYDPGVFVNDGQNDERLALLEDKTFPMLNRCYEAGYPPGSTFKLVMAAAALEEGLITPDTQFYCPGFFRLNENTRAKRCWNRNGHGNVGVVDALALSCDVFFFNVGLKLGLDKINHWSHAFGLGEPTGLDLPREESGLVPSHEWVRAIRAKMYPDRPWDQRWFPGDTLNLAIGQGDLVITPIQNAVLMAAIVNGGRRVQPYLNRDLTPGPSQALVSERTLAIIQEGLRKCVEKTDFPSGTGRFARVPGLAIIGKTGTAEVVSGRQHENYENEEDIPYELRDHALFVAATLDQDPPLAVSIMVEHGLHGSSGAAPLAAEIFRYAYGIEADDLHLAQNEAPR